MTKTIAWRRSLASDVCRAAAPAAAVGFGLGAIALFDSSFPGPKPIMSIGAFVFCVVVMGLPRCSAWMIVARCREVYLSPDEIAFGIGCRGLVDYPAADVSKVHFSQGNRRPELARGPELPHIDLVLRGKQSVRVKLLAIAVDRQSELSEALRQWCEAHEVPYTVDSLRARF